MILPGSGTCGAVWCGILFLFVACSVSAFDKQTFPLEFHHEEHGTPEFDSLLKEFDFDEAVKQGK